MRLAHTVGHAGISNVLCFGRDQWRIGSYKIFVQVVEEKLLCMEKLFLKI